MPDEPDFSKPATVPERKSLEEHTKAARLSAAYEQAKANHIKTQQQRQIGSDQVKKSAPGMHLRPTGMARSGPDAQAHAERLKADRQRTLERAEEALKTRKNKPKEKGKEY